MVVAGTIFSRKSRRSASMGSPDSGALAGRESVNSPGFTGGRTGNSRMFSRNPAIHSTASWPYRRKSSALMSRRCDSLTGGLLKHGGKPSFKPFPELVERFQALLAERSCVWPGLHVPQRRRLPNTDRRGQVLDALNKLLKPAIQAPRVIVFAGHDRAIECHD